MKTIIDGKRYDTSSAEEVASYASEHYANDFRSYQETLYRTKNGNWFVAGSGGPMSGYAVINDNVTTGGKGINPVSAEEALDWLEMHDETAAIELYFAKSIQEA